MYIRRHPFPSVPWPARAVAVAFLLIPALAITGTPAETPAARAPVSDATETCLACHESVTPGIVADWRASRHAAVTPEQALARPALERRISVDPVPEGMGATSVGCAECHVLRTDAHPDAFDHYGTKVNVVVSPDDCATCHPTEREQFAGTKKAHAVGNLDDNPLFSLLVDTSIGVPVLDGSGHLTRQPPSDAARMDACFGCHGTRVEVTGTRTIDSDLGPVEVPVLSHWPNQGVGRVNPDGSRGSCSACHARHRFSIAVARSPETCRQCHLDPDVPAYPVYKESKHGNLYSAGEAVTDPHHVPWRVGKDFTAPTCATCHNALVTADGSVVAERTHDFGARLWVRIFGLVYSHPQPESGDTSKIRNADGQPLPTTFAGEPAADHLIPAEEQGERRAAMVGLCGSCHSTSWAEGFFTKMDGTLEDTDRTTRTATALVQQAWAEGLADPANPFDEPIERMWVEQWLFWANSTRYGSAMSGPDYAAFKNGWWDLTREMARMQEHLELLRRTRAEGEAGEGE